VDEVVVYCLRILADGLVGVVDGGETAEAGFDVALGSGEGEG
jgi:hypothetical protein